MNKAYFTVSEGRTLKGMLEYWNEVEKREDKVQTAVIFHDELARVQSTLGSRRILAILGEYVTNYKVSDLELEDEEPHKEGAI